MALPASGRDHPCARRVSHFSRHPTAVAKSGPCLCASEGTPDECACYPDCIHPAAHAARRDRHRGSSTCLVLPSFHDCVGSSLSPVRIPVRHVAVCRPVRSLGRKWCCYWNVCAKAAQPWRLANSNATLPLRVRRSARCAAQLASNGVVMRIRHACRQVSGSDGAYGWLTAKPDTMHFCPGRAEEQPQIFRLRFTPPTKTCRRGPRSAALRSR
jgi:hypothetical protein